MTNNSVCRCLGFMAALGFRCWHAEDVVRCLADLGYGAVGWIMDHLHPGRSPDDLADLVRIPERYGVIASEAGIQPDFVTLDPSTYEEPVQSVAVSIPAAARAGITVANLFTGAAPWNPSALRLGVDISEVQAWELVPKAFESLLSLAEQHRVYLAVNMDPCHYRLYDNDVPWAVRRLGPRIRHVHLAGRSQSGGTECGLGSGADARGGAHLVDVPSSSRR